MKFSDALAGVTAASLLSACALPPPHRASAPGAYGTRPAPREQSGRVRAKRLTVLTYNVEGLGWPARSGRADSLQEIGRRLNQLRMEDDGPDVVLFQEVFSNAAKRAILASGYPSIVSGPRRTTRPPRGTKEPPLPGRPSLKRGEIGIHLLGGGLVIASRYPIIATQVRAFGRRSCAGLDCLSNKGVMLARVAVPGMQVPVDVYNTHMNSRRASHAPSARHRPAHARQSREIAEFILHTHNPEAALIMGGDFNMKHSELRWVNFSTNFSLTLVHEICIRPARRCDVRMSWDGDAPWMDTQDLQFFIAGTLTRIDPISVAALFDGGKSGPKLSDHDGFFVTYQLRYQRPQSDE